MTILEDKKPSKDRAHVEFRKLKVHHISNHPFSVSGDSTEYRDHSIVAIQYSGRLLLKIAIFKYSRVLSPVVFNNLARNIKKTILETAIKSGRKLTDKYFT